MNTKKTSDNSQTSTASDSFLVQGSILAAAGIIVRLIGLFYKIPLTRILGDDGIGYYNTAHEIYNIGLILSSYSLPLALSKLITAKRIRGQFQDSRRVFQCGMIFGVVSGGLMTLLMLFGADFITTYVFNMPGSALSLKVMAPTILVFSIMGVIRGYFQGHGTMVPTSVSQVIEQIVTAIVSITASYLFMNWYAENANPASYGASGGTLGILCGASASLIFLMVLMLRQRKQRKIQDNQPQSISVESWKSIALALFFTITPIILSQFVYQLSGSVDNSMFGLIMGGKGLSEEARASLLGVYSGKYRLLSNVPVAIASALGTSMIPSIIASRIQLKHQEVKDKIHLTVKFNMLIAIPCAVGMGVLAGPVMQLIFHDSTPLPARIMMIGSPAVIFFSLSTVTNAVLQGIDQMRKSVTHSAISLVIHIALVYVMLVHFDWGVYGLVIGNVTFALVVCILNWIAVGKALGYHQESKTTFFLPLLSAGIMGIAAYAVYHGAMFFFHSNTISMLIAVPLAMVVYGALIVLLKAVSEDELTHMPLGRSLLRVCRKVHLM